MNKYLWAKRLRGCMPDYLTPTEYIVLTMLASYTNKTGGGAAPAAARLADDCGKNVKTIRRSLASLVDKGYLSVTRPGGGRRRPTEYALADRMPHETENLDTQESTYDDRNMDTQKSTYPTPKRGHSEPETWTFEPRNVDTQMSTDQVDQEIHQGRPSAARPSPTHEAAAFFGDGVPIPPEPPADPPPTRGALALVHDANAPAVIDATRPPAPSRPSDAALALVRTAVPANVGRDIRTQLAQRVDRLRRDRDINPADIATALTEWANRPGAGPGLLPNLVADAARARTATTTPRETSAINRGREYLEVGERLAQRLEAQQHTTPKELP